MSTVTERIAALRSHLVKRGLDAYLVPSSDEHINEYLPPWRARRECLSGFTGSAGDLLVGRDAAWVFVDGRYHLQADDEVRGTGIDAVKVGLPEVKALVPHLKEMARGHAGLRVGYDPMVVPEGTAAQIASELSSAGGELVEVEENLADLVWSDPPPPATSVLMALPDAWTGSTPAEKLTKVRDELAKAGADAQAVVKLDQIAWLLNLRSRDDIPYNPVFESFLFVSAEEVHLFLRGAAARLPEGHAALISGLEVHDYAAFPAFLETRSGSVLVDPAGTTRGVCSALERAGCRLVKAPSPIEELKSRKNAAEQQAMRDANLRASVVKTRALLWLRREIAAGRTVTESGFREQIESLYAEQQDYFGLSFNTIAATGPHGAIIHYGACDETPLGAGDLFLIDSGAHIAGGTTDDTRTVAVGAADAEARRLYTLVLKGHINAARQTVPEGCPGTHLDALARSPMWNAGVNYDHGTGHGVGAYLNVHEGPFGISERQRKPYADHPLKEGIVSSIEPGYYREGWGGVRIENLYLFLAREGLPEGRKWLRLEPLTWVPFDPELIDPTLLDATEQKWIADYHHQCIEHLAPHLPAEELAELRELLAS